MPTIPSHHSVGDTGHTDDHNAVYDVLTDHQNRVAAIEGAQPTYMVKTGNNIVTLTNPSGVAEQVIVPSGTRDNTALVKSLTVGGKKVWWLDAYGMQRLEASSPGATPLDVAGYDNTHTADIQRWRKFDSGAVLSRVDAAGNIYAPNLTPTTWTNLTLASGIAWNSSLGARPQYRLIGDMVQLRGNVKRSNDADFTVTPTDVGTLPVGARPPNIVYSVQASTFRAGYGYVRMEILTSGLVRFYYQSSTYNPDWVSLDGFDFSLTA